ncbi:MAG: DUF1579 family protein [Phycisphaerales bacterium]
MRRTLTLLVVALALPGAPALAQTDAPAPTQPPEPESRLVPPDHPALADFADFLERAHEDASAGHAEERLRPLVGSWTFTTDLFVSPSARVRSIVGNLEGSWALDGRALLIKMTGQLDVAKTHTDYVALGLITHNADADDYTLAWRDSLAGNTLTYRGTFNDAGDQLVFETDAPQGRLRLAYHLADGALVGERTAVRASGTEDFSPTARTDLTPRAPAPDLPWFAVRLTPAPGVTLDESQRVLVARHLRHLRRLANEGHAVVSGSTDGPADDQLVLVRAPDADAARALFADDQAVADGALAIEVTPFGVLYRDPLALPARDDTP